MKASMVYRTFDQWNKKGYRILKGIKSTVRDDDGSPLFSKQQVFLRPYDNQGNEDYNCVEELY